MRLKITSGVNTWLISGESQAQADGNYQSRLLNELKLSQSLTALGSAPVTLNISVRNDDGYISPAIDLWGALVEITADGGTTWSGTITAYDSDGDGITYLVATEKAAPELTIQMPDEVARLVTVDENFHSSAVNVTLPLVFGGNSTKPHLVKGILIDKTAGIYLLCVGEIHQVVKVYRGTEEITTGFTAYSGTAGQANYAGFAYVQLTDDAIRKNDDGSYVEISADVIGLKLGSATIEQCRNGARVLYYLLTTAKDGVGGWGLGIGTSEINTTAFNQAISDVDAAGLKFDGIFYFRQAAQSWIDQICLAIRGAYSIGRDGKRALFINKSAASAKTYTETNMRMLRHGVGAYTGRVYNKGKLDFDYNPITGQFMQSAQFEDAVSVAAIGEQEFYGQSYLIKDMATAQAIVEYTCKKSLIGARKVYFETDELPTGARSGTVITVTRADLGISGDYQITSLEIGDHVHTIEAEKFDASIFAVGTPGTAIDWTKDPPIIPTINPGAASGLTLSSEVRPSPDGTNIIVLKGTFTPPAGKYLAASIEWGEGALPILSWNSLGMVQGNGFEIAPVKPAQAYAVRVRMTTSTGHSDYVTATITTEGDEVPPGAPSIGVTSYLKTVKIAISLASVPSDMAGFAIYRHTSNNSAAASQIGSITSKDGRATYTDEAPAYGATYYYWVKSFDTWGNPSSFSDGASTLITAISGTDIVDGALSRSALFAAGVVDATAIATKAITNAKLANDAVNTAQIAAGAITELKLANDAVTAAKLNVAAIDGVSGNIVTGAVGELQLAANAVTAAKIKAGEVGSTALATGAVTELKLANDAVTEAKIAAAAVNTAQLNNAALKAPLGAVLSLSAKNCTTASIAEVGGVRDVSGSGNHGQALGGVAVIDSEVGKAFQLNSSKYISIPGTELTGTNRTFSIWFKKTVDEVRYTQIFAQNSAPNGGANSGIIGLWTDLLGRVVVYDGNGTTHSAVATNTIPVYGEWYHLVGVICGGAGVYLYINGVLAASNVSAVVNPLVDGRSVYISGYSTPSFEVSSPKIFNRALSAAEVKSLYMFPEDAAFGNITADLLSTGELITKTAQIKDATITSAKISDLSADKINAGTLAAARIAAGSLAADKITGGALVVGSAAGDVNAGTTTVNGGKITADTVTASKLSVIARELVNPVSVTGHVKGWCNVQEDGTGTSSAVSYDATENAIKITTASGNYGIRSQTFMIDPNKIYRIACSVKKSVVHGEWDFGLSGFDSFGVSTEAGNDVSGNQLFTPYTTNRAAGAATINPYFLTVTGANVLTTYTDYVVYLIGANRSIDDVPQHLNASNPYIKASAAAKFGAIRFLNWGNTVSTSVFIKNVSVTEVGAGQIVADNIAAGAITAAKVTSGELITLTAQIKDATITAAKTKDLSADKITAGTLAAARIAAGSLAADKITGGALVIGSAAGDVNAGATTVNGGKITANSITTDRLLVAAPGAALAPDPNFEDASAWGLSSGSSIVQLSDGKVGGYAFRTRASTGASGSGNSMATSTKFIPVDPSKTYRRKFTARAVNGVGGATYIYDSYFDAAGVFLGTKSVLVGNPPSGTWTDYHAVFQYPATAKFVKIKVDANNGTPGASVYVEVQDNRLEEVLPTTLIQDGAVTTDKLFAEAVTTAKLAAGAVTAEKMLIGKAGAALNQDPNFEDASAWTNTGSTGSGYQHITIAAADAKVGQSAVKIYANNNRISSAMIPVDPGKSYRLRCWVKNDGAATGKFYLIYWVYTAIDSSHGELYITNAATIGTSWEERAGIFTPAANVRYVRIQVAHWNGTTGFLTIQDLRLEEALPATLIQDGAIITDKLAAGAVKAAKIDGGAVETAHLSAGCVTAEKVDATVVKTTELQVYGKNRCPDPSLDGVPYSSTYTSYTAENGLKIGGWICDVISGSGTLQAYHSKGTTYPISNFSTEAGSNALIILPASSGNQIALRTQKFAAKAGTPYNISLSLKRATMTTATATISVVWYNNSGAEISTTVAASGMSPQTIPTRYNYNITAPANTAFAAIKITATHSGVGSISFAAVQFEEGTAATVWVGGEQGTVTADKVVAGQLKSTNYSTTAGSMIDLDAGDAKFGGSSAPRFSFTTSTNTGTIAGFTFNGTDMTAGTSTNAIGISTDTAKKAFWAGHATPASAPFYVTHSGFLFSKSGSVGGFTITQDTLSVSATAGGGYNGAVELDSLNNRIGSRWAFYVNASNYGAAYQAITMDGFICSFSVTTAGVSYSSDVRVRASRGDTTSAAPFFANMGATTDFAFWTNANIYIGNNCSALSFTDRTEMPESMEEALEIINTMQPTKGKVDYKRLSNKAKKFTIQKAEDGSEYIEEGRDLTKTVSALIMICQKLQEENIRLSDRLAKLENSDTDEEREYVEAVEKAIGENRGNIRARVEAKK